MIQLELDDDLSNNVRDGNATAWRMESSLREFENFTPINFWFEYPIHRLDNSNLEKANAEGSPLANLSKSGKRTSRDDRREMLDTAFNMCAESGFTHVSDMAEYLGVDEKTIRRYLGEFKQFYKSERGVVSKVTTE